MQIGAVSADDHGTYDCIVSNRVTTRTHSTYVMINGEMMTRYFSNVHSQTLYHNHPSASKSRWAPLMRLYNGILATMAAIHSASP